MGLRGTSWDSDGDGHQLAPGRPGPASRDRRNYRYCMKDTLDVCPLLAGVPSATVLRLLPTGEVAALPAVSDRPEQPLDTVPAGSGPDQEPVSRCRWLECFSQKGGGEWAADTSRCECVWQA